MKKLLSLILAVAMCVSFVACGDSSGGDINTSSDISVDNSAAIENESVSIGEIVIEETVLVDENGVKITAKELNVNEMFGPELKLLIENNSGKDLTIQCRNTSVNGYMVETMMSVDIVNGKKANDAITFMNSDLEACGITNIADMEFSFHMFTIEDWETYFDTDIIKVKTNIADDYEYKFDDSGELAYEGNGVKIVIKGLSENDSIFGPGMIVYMENNGEETVTIQVRDVSINGFMVDSIFSVDIAPGKKAIDSITFMESDLEENDITIIENAELAFHIFNEDSWDTIVDTDVISISF